MKPIPHPEVVNPEPRVLIVGWGHVGQQIGKFFRGAHHVDIDGVIRLPNGIAVQHIPEIYEFGFYCVPTPPTDRGECDLDCLRAAVNQWHTRARSWCIKSTIPVGTTELFPNTCFSPEYYGETLGHPFSSGGAEIFIILGGDPKITREFARAWSLVTNSFTRIYQTDSRTAELTKLMENAWIATKVSFCNEFYDLAQLAGVDWNELRELWLADPRVGRSHTYVYPENRGWGGKCLPKDINNLCFWARMRGRSSEFLEFLQKYNRKQRETALESHGSCVVQQKLWESSN